MSFFYYIKSWFSTDAHVKLFQNKLAHLTIEYHKARTKISDAKKTFESVKEATVSDFQKLKQATIAKTSAAVTEAREAILEEEAVIEEKYKGAKDKIEVKRNSIVDLSKTVDSIGGADHPLE